MNNRKQMIKTFMLGWGEIHGKEITPILLNAYYEAMKPIPDDLLEPVLNKATMMKWFPKPAEIDEIFENMRNLSSPQTAWGMVYRAASEWVDYKPDPVIPDPMAVTAIKSLGGLAALANTDRAKLEWFQKRFIEVYLDLMKNPDRVKLLEAGPKRDVKKLIEGALKGLPEPKRKATAPEPSPSQKEKPDARKFKQNTPEELRRQAKKLRDLEAVRKIAEEEPCSE